MENDEKELNEIFGHMRSSKETDFADLASMFKYWNSKNSKFTKNFNVHSAKFAVCLTFQIFKRVANNWSEYLTPPTKILDWMKKE
eukprot:gene6244-10252_t